MADQFDTRIQRALATYSAAEPLEGLEDRILQKVQRRQRPARLLLALAACAAMLLLVMLIRQPQPKPIQPARFTHNPVVQPLRIEAAAPKRTHRARRARPAAPKLLPTQEELLLARYVAADPEGAAKAFASLNEAMNRDLTPQPLVVKPIQIESLQ